MPIVRVLAPMVAAAIACLATPLLAQQHDVPSGTTHEEHQKPPQKEAELKRRGAVAMGFDQDATAHDFRLAADGGSIEVSVKEDGDEKNRSAIRSHLKEIAGAFARGDFSKPFQTHAEVPPGVDGLQKHKDAITYTFDETPHGARVTIRTKDPDALKAIHAFLEYQISEHHTTPH